MRGGPVLVVLMIAAVVLAGCQVGSDEGDRYEFQTPDKQGALPALFVEFQEVARAYPGGVSAWRTVMMEGNPFYRYYIEVIGDDLTPAELNEQSISEDAFLAAIGLAWDIDHKRLDPPPFREGEPARVPFIAGMEGFGVRGELDCSDFVSRQRAQDIYLGMGGPAQDPYLLDDDSDGSACEKLR